MRKILFLCFVLFLTGCTFETHVSGIIIDEKTGLPVRAVQVRAIKEINGRTLEFAETHSAADGHFDLKFSTKSIRDTKVPVELNKAGYLTNMYTCHHEKTNDTLILRKQ